MSEQERDRESILSRLRKLERLATSSNEHEAALAAARYQEILFKYNLTEAEVGVEDEGDGYAREFTDQTEQLQWSRTLLNSVGKANFCSIVGKTGLNRQQVAVIGKPHNIEVVLFLHEYLSKELKRLAGLAWERQMIEDKMKELDDDFFIAPERNKRTYLQSFLLGAVESVHERLKAQRKKDEEANASSTALVVRSDQELRTAVGAYYPNLTNGRRSTARIDYTGYGAGQRAGSSVGLVQGVRDGHARTAKRIA